jgi:NIL domain
MSSHIVSHTHTTLSQKRIRLRIPKNYHEQPVISRLVSDFGTIVNINSASLKSDIKDDGWFDLELCIQDFLFNSPNLGLHHPLAVLK